MQRSGVGDGGLGGAVRGLRRAAGRRAGPRRPARAAAGLHAPACCCRASARASSRWRRGSTRPASGAAHQSLHHFVAKAAWDDAALLGAVRDYALPAMLERGPGPGLAGGRHRAAEEGQALGRGGAPVLRPARQAGELSGRGHALGRDRARQPAGRLPALPARGLGRGPGATGVGGGAGGGRVRDQARDRARPDPAGAGRRRPAGGGGDRRRLRQRHRLPRRGHRPGPRLRGRHPGHDRACGRPARDRCRPRRGAAGAGRRSGCGATRAPAARGREAGGGPARGRVADRHLAGRHGRRRWPRASRRCGSGRRTATPARTEPRAEEWFLAEWPEGEEEPTKYWLSTLPETAPLEELVATAKLRWRIERDFEELKQELGLGHFEGRGWRGFHHHASLCVAAYAFLVAERCRFSPPGWRPRLADARAAGRLPPPGLLPCARSGTARPRSRPCAGTWRSR